MNWFEQLVGFSEKGYTETQRALFVENRRLHPRVNGMDWGIGRFETPSLAELRISTQPAADRLRVRAIRGDVRALHPAPEYAGALFQLASQFNALEMPNSEVTPEDGVAADASDHTQGPACAMTCGAATIYRNYLMPCAGGVGQTRTRQLDDLAKLGAALATLTEMPLADLWRMQNGYALASAAGLQAIGSAFQQDVSGLDLLRGKLRIALHFSAEVTDAAVMPRPAVSQAFCSALPIAYGSARTQDWEPFARLVLEAAYEATLLSAVANASSGGSQIVLLTLLGGGVFGNPEAWIIDAMRRAFNKAQNCDIGARIVCYSSIPPAVNALVDGFA